MKKVDRLQEFKELLNVYYKYTDNDQIPLEMVLKAYEFAKMEDANPFCRCKNEDDFLDSIIVHLYLFDPEEAGKNPNFQDVIKKYETLVSDFELKTKGQIDYFQQILDAFAKDFADKKNMISIGRLFALLEALENLRK